MHTLIRNTAMLSAVLLVTLFCNAQQFILTGRIAGIRNIHLYIQYTNSRGAGVKDSCFSPDGNYRFTGDITEPTRIYFAAFEDHFHYRDDSDPNVTTFFAEPVHITANAGYNHIKEIKVTGSKTNDESVALQKQFAVLDKQAEPSGKRYAQLLNDYNKAKDKPGADTMYIDSLYTAMENAKAVSDTFTSKYQALYIQYIKTHPASYLSAWNLRLYTSYLPFDELKVMYSHLTPAIRNSHDGQEIAHYISKREENITGKPAKYFEQTGLDGKKVNLADFKGKYVLLDFWGSWCMPCRQSMPHLKELYGKYHKAGLEVIAVAVDDKSNAWKNAIQKDGTDIWYNVMDEAKDKAYDDKTFIHNAYDVHVFPTKILIGGDGTIIGRYDGTENAEALDKKLAELLGR